MAWSLIQTSGLGWFDGVTLNASNSKFSTTPVKDHLLVMVMEIANTYTSDIPQTPPTGWISAGHHWDNRSPGQSGGYYNWVGVYYKIAVSNEPLAQSVTLANTSQVHSAYWICFEFSGNVISNVLDATNYLDITGKPTTLTSASIKTTGANDLAIVMIADGSGTTDSNAHYGDWGSGFTTLYNSPTGAIDSAVGQALNVAPGLYSGTVPITVSGSSAIKGLFTSFAVAFNGVPGTQYTQLLTPQTSSLVVPSKMTAINFSSKYALAVSPTKMAGKQLSSHVVSLPSVPVKSAYRVILQNVLVNIIPRRLISKSVSLSFNSTLLALRVILHKVNLGLSTTLMYNNKKISRIFNPTVGSISSTPGTILSKNTNLGVNSSLFSITIRNFLLLLNIGVTSSLNAFKSFPRILSVIAVSMWNLQQNLFKNFNLAFASIINNVYIKTLYRSIVTGTTSAANIVRSAQIRMQASFGSSIGPIIRAISRKRLVNPVTSISIPKFLSKAYLTNVLSSINTIVYRNYHFAINLFTTSTTAAFKQFQPVFGLISVNSSNNMIRGIRKILSTPVFGLVTQTKSILGNKVIQVASSMSLFATKVRFQILNIVATSSGSITKLINRIGITPIASSLSTVKILGQGIFINVLSVISPFRSRIQTFAINVASSVNLSYGYFYTVLCNLVANSTSLVNRSVSKALNISSNFTVLFANARVMILAALVNSSIQVSQSINRVIQVSVNSVISIGKWFNSSIFNIFSDTTTSTVVGKQVNKVLSSIPVGGRMAQRFGATFLTGNFFVSLGRTVQRILPPSVTSLTSINSSQFLRRALNATVASTGKLTKKLNTYPSLSVLSSILFPRTRGKILQATVSSSLLHKKGLTSSIFVNPISVVTEAIPRGLHTLITAISSVNLIKQIRHPFAIVVNSTNQFGKRFGRILPINVIPNISALKVFNRITQVPVNARITTTKFLNRIVTLSPITALPLRKFFTRSMKVNISGSILESNFNRVFGIHRVKLHKTITINLAFNRPVDAWIVKLDSNEDYSSGTTLASYFGAPVQSGIAIFSSDLLLPGSNDVKVYARTAGTQFWSD